MLPLPLCASFMSVSLSQAGGGYDHQVAKSSLKELPETLASTAEGVPLALVEAMGVTIERLQEIVAIAATSILSLGLPRPPCYHCMPLPPPPPRSGACSRPAAAICGCQPFPCVLTVFSHGADYRSMRALSSAATEALVKDIAARLESEPPPLPVERSLSEPMTEPLVD